MREEIEVVDGLIPEETLAELVDFFKQPIWYYGWKSNRNKENIPNYHWNVLFAGSQNKSKEQFCEEELFANEFLKPIQDLWLKLKDSLLEGHTLVRVYANAHTYGTDGYVHTDSSDPDYYSTVCYIHQEWNQDWAGDLVFFNEEKTEITKAVYPKTGRIASFPGNVPHCARPLSRDCKELRMCLVFKTRKL